jgi:hypothetical protein
MYYFNTDRDLILQQWIGDFLHMDTRSAEVSMPQRKS